MVVSWLISRASKFQVSSLESLKPIQFLIDSWQGDKQLSGTKDSCKTELDSERVRDVVLGGD